MDKEEGVTGKEGGGGEARGNGGAEEGVGDVGDYGKQVWVWV